MLKSKYIVNFEIWVAGNAVKWGNFGIEVPFLTSADKLLGLLQEEAVRDTVYGRNTVRIVGLFKT